MNGVNLCIGVCQDNFYLNVRAASSPGQSRNSEQSECRAHMLQICGWIKRPGLASPLGPGATMYTESSRLAPTAVPLNHSSIIPTPLSYTILSILFYQYSIILFFSSIFSAVYQSSLIHRKKTIQNCIQVDIDVVSNV